MIVRMLCKIVLSSDKKSAIVHFDTHSVTLTSDTNVIPLVDEMFMEPVRQYNRMFEETMEIDLSLLDNEAA